MNIPSFKHHWIEKIAIDGPAYSAVIETDPFARWDRNRLPDTTAETALADAVALRCGDRDDLSTRFLQRAWEIADRCLAEGKCESATAADGFPKNRGRCRRVRVYARAFLGKGWQPAELAAAAEDFLVWSTAATSRPWDEITEAFSLAAARAFLVAGDLAGAQRWTSSRKRFKQNAAQHALLKEAAANEALELSGLRRLFDEVRNPEYRPGHFVERELVALELAILLTRHGPIGTEPDWRAVTEAIAR